MKRDAPFSVIYADDSILVCNKKSGLLVAADRYDADAPRLDLLATAEFGRLYAVHRIDKDTSGLVIYARTPEAHRNLSMQFEEHVIKKLYHALINGRLGSQTVTVDEPLLPDGDSRHRTVLNRTHGKPSRTVFTQLEVCGPYSWIEARPETGRTHQIRAHLLALGVSVVCDPLYGANTRPVRLSDLKRSWRGDPWEERPLLNRLALHAFQLELEHPATGEQATFTAPYHRDFAAALKQLLKLSKPHDRGS
jgi:RluA family pseudouridine synthase